MADVCGSPKTTVVSQHISKLSESQITEFFTSGQNWHWTAGLCSNRGPIIYHYWRGRHWLWWLLPRNPTLIYSLACLAVIFAHLTVIFFGHSTAICSQYLGTIWYTIKGSFNRTYYTKHHPSYGRPGEPGITQTTIFCPCVNWRLHEN